MPTSDSDVTRKCPPADPTLTLPRILCLHGGGTNARIFRAQCRIIRRHLEGDFRLVFADAPFFGKPGPDVTSVYADWGPFRSWIKPTAGATVPPPTPRPDTTPVIAPVDDIEADIVSGAIDTALASAMRDDDARGASGIWVGLLGFSQGAKLAASILLREQVRADVAAQAYAGVRRSDVRKDSFAFAVLLAGRGPLVTLDAELHDLFGDANKVHEPVLRLPTVHVHGLLDEGLAMHRAMMRRCCAPESVTLVEWEGNHRVPIKAKDVVAVTEALRGVYQWYCRAS